MENASNTFSVKLEKVFYGLCNEILSYLDFQSLIQLLPVSTDFYNLANTYFKYFLLSNKLISNEEVLTSGDQYLSLFRSFYSREILLAPLSGATSTYSELTFTRYPRCSMLGVKDFAYGSKFTVFQLFNDDIIFLKSDEYVNPLFNMKFIGKKNIRKNVQKFFLNSKDLYYLTNSGQIHVIFYDESLNSHQFTEGLLEFTLQHPVQDCAFSYYHAVLLLKIPEEDPRNYKFKIESKPEDQLEEKKEDQKLVKKETLYQDVRILGLQDMLPQDLNAPIRLSKAHGLDDKLIKIFVSGNNQAYFVADSNEIFELDFSEMNNNMYMIFPFKHFQNKVIKKLWCGFNFFFALEQKEIESIEHWSKDDINNWLKKKGFDDFLNIVKYENVTGKDLLEADKTYLIDKLGMMREDLQTKFLNEIVKVSKKTLEKPRLFAWGNNLSGQLGVNVGHTKVIHPTEVPLPDIDREDEIKHIECGWNQTIILTVKGSVWISEIMARKPNKEKEKEINQNDDDSKDQKGKKSKKSSKRKESELQEKEEKELSKTPGTRWLDFTPTCERLKDMKYKTIKVSLCKESLAVLGSNQGKIKKSKGTNGDNTTSFSKFKGADHIFNRILWDKKMIKDEYAVGYEDRFLGILEIPFLEFAQKTDIPSHRIKFFKKNGDIVWDRTLKINKL